MSRGNRLQASLNALTGLVGVVLSLSSVWAMQNAIDIAAAGKTGDIAWAVGLMALLILFNFALTISRIWIRNILGIKAQNRMQRDMLSQQMLSEWKGRDERHSADVVNRIEDDVTNVVTFITETLPDTLSTIALFLGAFFYLLRMDVWLAIATVAILPIFILVSRYYVNKMRGYTRLVRQSDSLVQGVIQEAVQNRMIIKTMECASTIINKLDDRQSTLRSQVWQRTKFSVASSTLLNLGFASTYLLAFAWSAVRMAGGTLTFGGMTAFLQLVYRIQNPTRDLIKLAPAFVGVLTAAERLIELDNEPKEIQGEPIALDSPCGVKLDNVSFRYDDNDVIITNLSFDFRPNTCTAILGETGAGKTTLVRLILALTQPSDGHVYIYNKVKTVDASPLTRCNIAYVPQGNTLMSGTIRDNLLLAKPNATDEELYKALSMACADFVDELPKRLDTIIGEEGSGLSEGQAQRIAIARALLRPCGIMIFDEATSALDIDTEHQLLDNLLSNKKHTIIFITHRQAVVEYCDEVLRL